jgi:hypothetical protein
LTEGTFHFDDLNPNIYYGIANDLAEFASTKSLRPLHL